MRSTERRRLVVIDEHAPIAKRDEADDRRAGARRDEADDRRIGARRDEPIPADDRGRASTIDGPVRGDDRDMLAPGSLQGVSSRSSLGRAVMPRDGRRLIALVTRMRGPSRVMLVARRALVTNGRLRVAIVARGQS